MSGALHISYLPKERCFRVFTKLVQLLKASKKTNQLCGWLLELRTCAPLLFSKSLAMEGESQGNALFCVLKALKAFFDVNDVNVATLSANPGVFSLGRTLETNLMYRYFAARMALWLCS